MRSAFSTQLLNELGAWGYGIKIVSEIIIPHVKGIDTPTYFAFDLKYSPAEILQQIQPSGSDWAIKYSCRGEKDFSHNTRRGDNSSLGRTLHLNKQSYDFAIQRVERLLYHAPRHSAKIVFQELIDQSNGYLFHADLADNRLELEILYHSHRVLVTSNYVSDPVTETSGGIGLSPTEVSEIFEIAGKLQICRERLRSKFLCDSWTIEGFWETTGPTMRLLQLRPTPLDRPQSRLELEPAFLAERTLFDSGFVWGICDKEIAIVNGEIEANGVMSLSKSDKLFVDPKRAGGAMSPDPYDSAALSRFASGSVDLVVRSDSQGASRLSHEPWFLPPPEYRFAFCHIWIPKNVISRFEGKRLRLISDGDRARLVDGLQSATRFHKA